MKKDLFFAALTSLVAAGASSGCSVDFDGLNYDDTAFEAEKAKEETDGGDGDASQFCLDFCDDAGTFCGFGTELGYDDATDCLKECAEYSDEELECRLVEVRAAEDDPATHCPNTLADGGENCAQTLADLCEEFCGDSATICPFGSLGYASEQQCLDVCGRLPEASLGCRITHLGFARDIDAAVHCPHTLADGGGKCDPAP